MKQTILRDLQSSWLLPMRSGSLVSLWLLMAVLQHSELKVGLVSRKFSSLYKIVVVLLSCPVTIFPSGFGVEKDCRSKPCSYLSRYRRPVHNHFLPSPSSFLHYHTTFDSIAVFRTYSFLDAIVSHVHPFFTYTSPSSANPSNSEPLQETPPPAIP